MTPGGLAGSQPLFESWGVAQRAICRGLLSPVGICETRNTDRTRGPRMRPTTNTQEIPTLSIADVRIVEISAKKAQ